MDFSKKTAIVTGGAQGIGRGIAEKLSFLGATVVIADIGESQGMSLAALLSGQGADVRFIKTNMKHHEAVHQMVDQAAGINGTIDILVNCAGVLCEDALLEDQPIEVWDHVMGVNLNGAFYSCKYVLKYMHQQKNGSIINISSTAAIAVSSMDPPYAVSKTALLGLTRSIAYDYSKLGVRCNAICPASTMTTMVSEYLQTLPADVAQDHQERWLRNIPMGRLGTVEDIAEAVAFLASPASSFITGVALPVDGGLCAV